MTDDVTYEYTGRDLLEEPETYEYSTVHGRSFFDAYFDDRNEALETIAIRFDDHEGVSEDEGWDGIRSALDTSESGPGRPPILRSSPDADWWTTDRFDPMDLQPPSEQAPFETVRVLASVLGYQRTAPPSGDTESAWLDWFTKRFEVDKRLYERYEGPGRSDGVGDAPLVAYPMTLLAVLVDHDRTGNLKYLNVGLKLGDLVSAKATELGDPMALSLARLALDAECTVVRSLADRKEVRL